ncbi:MAG: metal-binding protein [Synechococcales bacterium]|nr:metal-binding protein [Synechococcales bacterium]
MSLLWLPMPSGRTHDSITLWSLPFIAIATGWITQNSQFVLILSGCFLFSGLMFGPDLDIHSQQYKRWGWLRWIWLPYRHSMSHRSLLSHGPMIGTIVRILYLLTLGLTVVVSGLVGWAIAQQSLGLVDNWVTLVQPIGKQSWAVLQRTVQHHWPSLLAGLIGLEIGAMSHSLSDWLGSGWKQLQKRGRR